VRKQWFLYKNNYNFGKEEKQVKALVRLEHEAGRPISITERGDIYSLSSIRMANGPDVFEARLEVSQQ